MQSVINQIQLGKWMLIIYCAF